MADVPNRIGAMRGVGGTTLDDILGALQALGGAPGTTIDYSSYLERIATALEAQAAQMTANAVSECGTSPTTVLCKIGAAIGADFGQNTPELPEPCPGYSIDRYIGQVSGWYRNSYGGNLSPDWYGTITLNGAEVGITTSEEFSPYPTDGGILDKWLNLTMAGTNICMVAVIPEGSPINYDYIWQRIVEGDPNGLETFNPLNDAGTHRLTYHASEYNDRLQFRVHNMLNQPIETAPEGVIYLFQGALG
jgi:hypothetical protein